MSRRQKIAAGSSAAVVVVLAVVLAAASVFASPAKKSPAAAAAKTGTASTPTVPTATAAHVCPLTGQTPRGGVVPERPALAIKIGNDPASRPQSGLPDADIVYEEMAEGGVTRYLALFQCREAAAVGPVRSVRWDDWHILASYGHPILAFSGGIDQWDALVARLKWLYDANGSAYPQENAFYRTSNRVPPWNYYSSTAALWKLDASAHTPPRQQFHYSASPPAGATASKGVEIVGFAAGANVVWHWSASAGAWERFYGTTPDVDVSGQQLHATNVVVQMVQTKPGPYAETADIPDTDSITKGSGVAYVFRNGKVERGTWRTRSYRDRLGLYFPDGQEMTLEPGNTWVEMVPTSYAVQVSK